MAAATTAVPFTVYPRETCEQLGEYFRAEWIKYLNAAIYGLQLPHELCSLITAYVPTVSASYHFDSIISLFNLPPDRAGHLPLTGLVDRKTSAGRSGVKPRTVSLTVTPGMFIGGGRHSGGSVDAYASESLLQWFDMLLDYCRHDWRGIKPPPEPTATVTPPLAASKAAATATATGTATAPVISVDIAKAKAQSETLLQITRHIRALDVLPGARVYRLPVRAGSTSRVFYLQSKLPIDGGVEIVAAGDLFTLPGISYSF